MYRYYDTFLKVFLSKLVGSLLRIYANECYVLNFKKHENLYPMVVLLNFKYK
jgi:hypothetical protein